MIALNNFPTEVRATNMCRRRHTMKQTLFLTCIFLTLMVSGILTYGSYLMYSNILLEKTIDEKQKNVDLAAGSVGSLISNVIAFSRLTVLNTNLQQLAGNQLQPAEEHNYGYMLKDDLNYTLQNMPDINDIIVNFEDGRLFCTSNVDGEQFAQNHKKDVAFTEPFVKFSDKVHLTSRRVEYLRYAEPTFVISVNRPIISYLTTDMVGVLQFDILETAFSDIFSTALLSDNAKYYLLDESGQVISSTDKSMIFTKPEFKSAEYEPSKIRLNPFSLFGKSQNLVLINQLPQYDWQILAIFPVEEIMRENRSAMGKIWILAGICTIFSFLPIYLISNRISRPLQRLSQTMERVSEGDLHALADDSRRDEIGLISGVFNKMMRQIANLIEQNQLEQQEKRKFEFMAIQQQIQPHFLYNTLENICALVVLKYNDEAFRMTKALARFYRVCLSGGHMLIPLEKELEIADKYLTIQKIRFKDSFSYDINQGPGLDDILVPKLIIQPLVENALVHGIRDCDYHGKISISCSDEKDYICIRVTDNGKGFDEEILSQFAKNALEAELTENRNFGVQSIVNRLRFYYDPACKMTIENLEMGGSRVSIVLKKELKSNE